LLEISGIKGYIGSVDQWLRSRGDVEHVQ